MKNTLLTFLFAAFATILFAQKPKVIEHPAYEVSKTGIYNITKIVLTDSSTRLTIKSTFLPKWWVRYEKDEYISDSKSGKKYQVIGIEGAALDEKLWMPASGDSTIVLIFPKLEEGVEKIDYHHYIYGLSLKNRKKQKEKNEEIPAHVSEWMEEQLAEGDGNVPLDLNSAAFFKEDTAHIIGYIKGYDPRLGFSTGIIYTDNALTREDYPTVVQVFEDGRFEAKLPLQSPVYTYMVINDRTINFYAEPGKNLAIHLDWEEFLKADRLRNIRYKFKEVEFAGPLAKVNHDLAAFDKKSFNYKEYQKKLSTHSPEEFKKEQDAALKVSMEKLEDYIAAAHPNSSTTLEISPPSESKTYVPANPVSPKAATILKNELLLENRAWLFDFVSDRSYMARKDSANVVLKQPVPEDYYSFLKAMPLDDQSLLVSKEFSHFINRFEYSDPFDDVYGNVIKNGMLNYMLEEWQAKDSVVQDLTGAETNLTYEVTKVRTLKYASESMSQEEVIKYWKTLKTGISRPALVEAGDNFMERKFAGNGIAYELPAGKATDVFKKITEPYKGKILFVDFWATSCGPCVASIQKMKETRKKYKDNPDFDFIFITEDRASPEEKYQKFVEEQSLNNTYRIAKEDFYYLRQLFKFNGIPRYIVLDKEGRVMDDNFKMYNFESELEKILAQK